MNRTARVKLQSVSPISFGRYYHNDFPKKERETSADYEERTWMERAHYDANGNVFIGGFAFKNCIGDAAKFLSLQVPGKGKATYTKHFDAGLMVIENISLNRTRADIQKLTIHAPADGRPGGPKRVIKHFPTLLDWDAEFDIFIFDEAITKDVLVKHIQEAGKFIGLGSLRVRNRGIHGRFSLVSIDIKDNPE